MRRGDHRDARHRTRERATSSVTSTSSSRRVVRTSYRMRLPLGTWMAGVSYVPSHATRLRATSTRPELNRGSCSHSQPRR
jgi:hypothetical protein